MHRIDSTRFKSVQLPSIPHYDTKLFVAEERSEAVNWLPAPSGEVIMAAAHAINQHDAMDACLHATRRFAYLRFDNPNASCSELLARIITEIQADQSKVKGLVLGVLATKDHAVHLTSFGSAYFRHFSQQSPDPVGMTPANTEFNTTGTSSVVSREIEIGPGESIGLFPITPADAVLANSQTSFMNVGVPGPLVTGLVIQRKEQRNLKWQLDQLTDRERETLELIMQGKSVKEIAAEMNITIQTVSKHRGNLWDKLGVANDVQVVLRMLTSPQ